MPLNEVAWGYCRHCNKEVEVRDGVLIVHDVTYNGGPCRGSCKPPSQPPREGTWEPPLRPVRQKPDAAGILHTLDHAPPPLGMWASFFRRVGEG